MELEDFFEDLSFQLKAEKTLLDNELKNCNHLFIDGDCIFCTQKKMDISAHLSK